MLFFSNHAKWSPGHFGSRSSPLLFKSSWSPLGPGNMAQWGQGGQQGDRRGWGGRDRGDRDQWTGGRSGGGGGGYGAHNPYEIQLPKFLTTVVTTDDKDWSSIMMVDKRDDRLVSPFQAWLVSEIMANSASSINVLTERDQVMPPNAGFHLSLFANYTLDIPPQAQSVVDGIHPLQGHWLTRPFSHFRGLCSGRPVLPTQIWRSTTATRSSFTGCSEDTGLTLISRCSSSSWMRSWCVMFIEANPASRQWWRSSLDGEWRSCHSNAEVAPMRLVQKARS